ncbi:DNA polymerase III subunit delta [Mucisphaera sp.]|uniref:DNA polymerase III subunit delta n=1 Tax=Mucisphaera sp. TaxID=2913024 RepID=UPI003D0FD8D9
MARKTKAKVELDAGKRVVVLHGKERLVQQLRLRELTRAIEAEHGETDPIVLDGRTAALADVFDELRTFGLMQSHKLVVVEEAEAFVKEHRSALERYAESPSEHATLVLRSPVWRKGKLDKRIEQIGAIVACEPPSPREAAAWLTRRAKAEHGAELRPEAASMLVERLGTDLARLDQEVGKLTAMVENDRITTDDVLRVVGKSSDEQAWIAQDAALATLSSRRASHALEATAELIDLAGQPEVLVTYFVADGVRKLSLAQRYAARRVGAGEIAKRLKLWGPKQRVFLDIATRLDPEATARLFDLAVESDARSKRGFGTARCNLETLCIRLADVPR